MYKKSYDIVGDALVFLLAVALPFHSVMTLPLGRANISLADPILLFGWLLVITGVISKLVLPRFAFAAVGLVVAVGISVSILPVLGADYMNLRSGGFEVLKIVYAVSYFLLLTTLFRQGQWNRLYLFGLGTILVLTAVSLWTSVETLQGVRRPSGSFDNPNIYGDYLVFGIFVTLFIAYRYYRDKILFPLSVFCFPVGLAALSLLGTQSRASVAGLGLALGFVVAMQFRTIGTVARKRPGTVALAGGGSLAFVYGMIALKKWPIVRRFRKALEGQSSEWNRLDFWGEYLDAFIDNPLVGIGYGQYNHYLSTKSPHNTLIRLMAETGLVGTSLFILMALLAFRYAFRLIVVGQRTELIFILGFLIASGANSIFHDVIHFRTFWIALAILGAYSMPEPSTTETTIAGQRQNKTDAQ